MAKKSKRAGLVARARERVVTKRTGLLQKAATRPAAPPPARTWKAAGVSLYADEMEWLDALNISLHQAAGPKANRSYIIQHAVRQLAELLDEKTPAEIAAWFRDRDVTHLRNGKPPLKPPTTS